MKANEQEFRIKNWVRLHVNHSDYNEFQIEIEDLVLMAKSKQHQYSPIPLTEEWLKKFGFSLKRHYYTKKHYGALKILLHEDGIRILVLGLNIDHIKHVHELQNLFRFLFGEELTIK